MEANKKEIAMKMLEKVIESIDKGRVRAIHLALQLNAQEPDDNNKETEDNSEETEEEGKAEESKEEYSDNSFGACPKCASNRDKCKCA